MNIRNLGITGILLLLSWEIVSQSAQTDKEYIQQKSLGFRWSVGDVYKKLPEYDYYIPMLFALRFEEPLLEENRIFNFSIYSEAQFNLNFLGNAPAEIEFGLNMGYVFSFLTGENTIIYVSAGTGPHYFGVETTRQAKGFIFSNNFMLGFRHRVFFNNKPYEFLAQAGYRHISSADFTIPNLGLDNLLVGIGVSKLF